MTDIREPTIWFEVGEFIEYFHWAKSPTGIQRVQIEIFSEAKRRGLVPGRIRFCRLDRYTHHFVPVEFAEVAQCFQGSHQISGFPPVGARVVRWISRRRADLWVWRRCARGLLVVACDWFLRRYGRMKVDARISCFAGNDIVVCLGNAWEDRRYGELISLARRERSVRLAVLVYDLIPVTHPLSVTAENALMFRRWLDSMIKSADLVFAISEYSRTAVVSYAKSQQLRIPPVEILPLGTGFRVLEGATRGEAMARLPHRFVLFVSTLTIRKNHQLMTRVWGRLVGKHGADNMPHLLFVGQIGWLVSDLMAELNASRYLDGKIVILSDLSDAEIGRAYEECLFTVYPSFAEGWGLPIAESLEHGKLCVASNCTAMPEVGGELIDYVDPEDLEGATAAIERVIFDEEYRRRREAQIRAKYRPRSWVDSFSALIGALQDLCKEASDRHATVAISD